jgi:hypothetical protein
VYQALTGIKPRGHGETWRAPAPWRDTSDCNLSLHDGKGTWYDFAAGEGGGVLDLVARVRGCNRADALHWCAELAGLPIENKSLSAEDRKRWARKRHQLERDLPVGRLWRRAVIALGWEALDALKSALFDAAAPMRPEIGEVAQWTRQLATWQRLDDAALMEEYHWWRQHHPGITAALVRAAEQWEQTERRAIQRYLKLIGAEAA